MVGGKVPFGQVFAKIGNEDGMARLTEVELKLAFG